MREEDLYRMIFGRDLEYVAGRGWGYDGLPDYVTNDGGDGYAEVVYRRPE